MRRHSSAEYRDRAARAVQRAAETLHPEFKTKWLTLAQRYESAAIALEASAKRRGAAGDPRILRLKAIELRAVADTLSTPSARRDLLELADGYHRMAAFAERRTPRK